MVTHGDRARAAGDHRLPRRHCGTSSVRQELLRHARARPLLAVELRAVRARNRASFGAAQNSRARRTARGVRPFRRRPCARQRRGAEAAAMMLHELAAVSAALDATRSRSEKTRMLA